MIANACLAKAILKRICLLNYGIRLCVSFESLPLLKAHIPIRISLFNVSVVSVV